MVMDLDTMEDMDMAMCMARGKPRLRLSPTTMVDSMAMDLDTMEDMAMDMYMARGKPRLKLSPTTMVDSMAMDLDTMEDIATDVYGKREAEAEAEPYYYGGLYGHGLGYYGGWPWICLWQEGSRG